MFAVGLKDFVFSKTDLEYKIALFMCHLVQLLLIAENFF